MDHRSLNVTEREALRSALRGNADHGTPLRMSRDTSFVGGDGAAADDVQVIDAVSSVPCHY